jgi:hypothetical protein
MDVTSGWRSEDCGYKVYGKGKGGEERALVGVESAALSG